MGGNSELEAREHFSIIRKCIGRRYDKYWKAKASNRNPIIIKQLKTLILDLRRQLLHFESVMEHFKNKADKLSTLYDFDKSTYIASPFVSSVYPNAYHKYEDFMPSIELAFEDTTFKAPNNYDGYLKRLYGDYMTPPPIEQRTGHMPYFVDLNLPFEKYNAPYMKQST